MERERSEEVRGEERERGAHILGGGRGELWSLGVSLAGWRLRGEGWFLAGEHSLPLSPRRSSSERLSRTLQSSLPSSQCCWKGEEGGWGKT